VSGAHQVAAPNLNRVSAIVQALPPAPCIGSRGAHCKFGLGTVVQVDGQKLTVAFDAAGPRRVLASFVRFTAGA